MAFVAGNLLQPRGNSGQDGDFPGVGVPYSEPASALPSDADGFFSDAADDGLLD